MRSSAGSGTPVSLRPRHLSYPTAAGILVTTVGGWLFLAPFVIGYGQPARLADMVTGAVAAFTGMMLVLRAARTAVLCAFVAILGAGLVAAPMLMPISDGATWNAVVAGTLLIILALVGSVPATGDR